MDEDASVETGDARGGPRILLLIGGGIAAYKSCELIRLLRADGAEVTCVLTEGGARFVTPMALAALSENPVHTDLWSLKDEVEIGHIKLSRQADLIVVCPATANMLAKMAQGIADDLASTVLLATDTPVLAVPAMNVRMWSHEATQRNVGQLRADGVVVLDPDSGAMACGEFGPGRLPEPEAIRDAIGELLDFDAARGSSPPPAKDGTGGLLGRIVPRASKGETVGVDAGGGLVVAKGAARAAPPTDAEAINHEVRTGAGDQHPEPMEPEPIEPEPIDDADRPLEGRHVLVTAGPTREAIDPVRYIANRSSGRQGFAIAEAARAAGARVTLIAGPVSLETPAGVDRVDVETAREMDAAVREAMPADVAVMVAAVADWRVRDAAEQKMKKRGSAPPALILEENPDILAGLANRPERPGLIVGFAAETQNVIENAKVKRQRKGADWIVANDVSDSPDGGAMGGAENSVHIVTSAGVESLPRMPKHEVAERLVARMAEALARRDDD